MSRRISNVGFGLVSLLLARVAARADVTYQETIRPLFQETCLNCHNPDKHKAGLDLSTYDATMDGSDNGKVVEAGDAEKSLLYKVLAHTEQPYMPKGADKLPDAQLDAIRKWIAASAPDKSGDMVAKKDAGPAISLAVVEDKPKGPPAMPKDGLLEPYIRTIRAGAVPSVAGSPWAPLVALAGQEQVLLYNTDTMDLAGVLPFPEGFPQIVRFSHNGGLLIAGGGVGAKLGHVVIWDVVTGKRLAEIGDEFDSVLAADISPDQSLVALGGPGRLVKIFTVNDGKMIAKMKKHTDWVTALCFTPDGKMLISGDRAGGLSAWDTMGRELQSVSAHTAAITGIACRGNVVATSSEDGDVKFWDMVEGKQLKSWHAHDGGVRSVAFTQDGQIVTSGRDHLVRLWNANGGMVKQFDPLADIAMQADAAGGKIIAADWTGLVRVWTPDGKRAGDLDSNPPTLVQRVDLANKRLADLAPLQARVENGVKQAVAGVAAAEKRAADTMAALAGKRSEMGDIDKRIIALQGEQAADTGAIQKTKNDEDRLTAECGQLAWCAAADPVLEGAAYPAFVSREVAHGTLTEQRKTLQQTQAGLAQAQQRRGALGGEMDALGRANAAAAAGVKAAESTLAAMKAAEAKTADQVKAANSELVKWRSAANRLNTGPQYALRKTDGK
jgi:mono/diheme cytochrome c family protein